MSSRLCRGSVAVKYASDRAALSKTAAWDAGDPASTSLSFYVQRLASTTSFKKKVAGSELPGDAAHLSPCRPAFRYANDAASGAVTVALPPSR